MRIIKLFAFVAILLLQTELTYGQWANVGTMPEVVNWNCTVAYNGKIYSFGGADQIISNAAYAYDTLTGVVTKVGTIPEARYGAYAALINGKIYIAGGYKAAGSFATATYEFDPATNKFTKKANIPSVQGAPAGAMVDNKLYLIGGLTTSNALTDMIQVYDPATNSWNELSKPLSTTLAYPAATVMAGKIYLVGGNPANTQTYSNHSYRGTVGTDGEIQWESLGDLSAGITRATCGSLGGKVYYTTGAPPPTNGDYSKTYVYNESQSKWVATFSLPKATYNCATLVGEGNSLYLIGGLSNPNIYKFTPNPNPAPVIGLTNRDFFFNVISGESTSFTIPVSNYGTANLTGTVSIPSDAEWLTTSNTTFVTNVNSTKDITINLNTEKLASGLYQTQIDVVTNDKLSPSIPVTVAMYVVPKTIPTQPTKVVVEEATGDWCGYCPYGHEILDALKETHGENLISIALHGGSATEPMRFGDGDSLIKGLKTNGYPNAAIQRRQFAGEANRMTNRGAWEQYVTQVFDETPNAPVSIEVLSFSFDQSTRKLMAQIKCTSAQALPAPDANTSVNLSVMITEDSIKSTQTKYSLTGGPTVTIKNYNNNDVLRQCWNGYKGKALAVKGEVVGGGKYVAPGASEVVNVELTVDEDIVLEQANVVILAHSVVKGNLADVLQGSKVKLLSKIGAVQDVEAKTKLALANFPNPSNGVTQFTYFLPKNCMAKLELFNVNGQKVMTLFDAGFTAGTYNTKVDLTNLPNGLYTAILSNGTDRVLEKISVVK